MGPIRSLRLTRRLGRFATSLLLVCAVTALGGCPKPKQANTKEPEDVLLFEWGQALLAGDKQAALKLYDLELRQKLQFWDKTMKPITNPTKQAELLAQNLTRFGEAAAMQTVGDEAWAEVKDQPWVQELADGKCVSGAPTKDDIGKGVVPKERKEMPQELGMWVFELRNAIGWSPTFRVNCPTSGSFWVQIARRKKDATATDEAPLKVIRVAR